MESSFGPNHTAEQVTEGVDLSGQTWLVTGCNSGLGLESTRVLGLRGAHVIGLARSEAKARAALEWVGTAGTPVACDLSEPSSVRAALAAVEGRPLDGVMANAGIMALPERQLKHGLELQFLTNHLGHFGLVTGLMGQLTPKARVVVLTSSAHFRAAERGLELDNLDGARDYEAWRMYGRSKLANVMFARGLAQRFSAAGGAQAANSVHPGVIVTNLARHVPDQAALYERMRDRMKELEPGAATQCYVAVHPEVAGVTGQYFADCAVADPAPVALDDGLTDQLWTVSEELWAAR